MPRGLRRPVPRCSPRAEQPKTVLNVSESLFDDSATTVQGSPEQVHFSGGHRRDATGSTKANSLSYSVWLRGVALIVSTNSWLHDVTPSEAHWAGTSIVPCHGRMGLRWYLMAVLPWLRTGCRVLVSEGISSSAARGPAGISDPAQKPHALRSHRGLRATPKDPSFLTKGVIGARNHLLQKDFDVLSKVMGTFGRRGRTFAWRESTPHIVFGNHRSGAACARACNELHYYCQAPKWGALRSASNYLSLCTSITTHQQKMQEMLEEPAQAAAGVVFGIHRRDGCRSAAHLESERCFRRKAPVPNRHYHSERQHHGKGRQAAAVQGQVDGLD